QLRIFVAGDEQGGSREVHLVLRTGDHVDELAPVRLRHSEDLEGREIIPILDRAAYFGDKAVVRPREEAFMILPSASRRTWTLILAAAVAAAGGCAGNSGSPVVPTGTGGELKADISASATSGRAPLDITFTSNVHGGEGAYRYAWSFGDGRTSAAPDPRVQFQSGGSFDVTLQVSAGGGTGNHAPATARP